MIVKKVDYLNQELFIENTFYDVLNVLVINNMKIDNNSFDYEVYFINIEKNIYEIKLYNHEIKLVAEVSFDFTNKNYQINRMGVS